MTLFSGMQIKFDSKLNQDGTFTIKGTNMTVQEAYEHGKKAYDDGADINHVPGHYSRIEVENFQAGYLAREDELLEEMLGLRNSDDDYDLEDISLYPDSTEED